MEQRIVTCNTTENLAKTLDMLGWMEFTIVKIDMIADDFGGSNKYKVVYTD